LGSFSKCIKTVFYDNFIVIGAHPPNNSDLAPSDFWLFGDLKRSVANRVFNEIHDLFEAVIGFLNEIQLSELHRVPTTGSNE
jgi:ABC-type transporter Mla MlaB component